MKKNIRYAIGICSYPQECGASTFNLVDTYTGKCVQKICIDKMYADGFVCEKKHEHIATGIIKDDHNRAFVEWSDEVKKRRFITMDSIIKVPVFDDDRRELEKKYKPCCWDDECIYGKPISIENIEKERFIDQKYKYELYVKKLKSSEMVYHEELDTFGNNMKALGIKGLDGVSRSIHPEKEYIFNTIARHFGYKLLNILSY